MSGQDRLFAVCLGGRAERCNTELHDVVFVTGASIEAAYDQLPGKWFGLPDGLHIDVWTELDVVDGHEVSLAASPAESGPKLYFINLGAYRPGEFAEAHACAFLVAASPEEAKRRAKATLLTQGAREVHTDDLYEVDSCIELGAVNDFHVRLARTGRQVPLEIHASYHPLPKAIIDAHVARRAAETAAYRPPFD